MMALDSWRGQFTGLQLPHSPFHRAGGKFIYFQYAQAFSDGMWQMLSTVGLFVGDESIFFKDFDSEADTYYLTRYGCLPMFSFALSTKEGAYASRMFDWPMGHPADAMAFQCDEAGWWGSTGNWACWGERKLGLCVLQLPDNLRLYEELREAVEEHVTTFELEEILHDVVRDKVGLIDNDEFDDFAEKLKRTFQSN